MRSRRGPISAPCLCAGVHTVRICSRYSCVVRPSLGYVGTTPMRVASRAPVANSMLAALPRKQYQRLLTGLESVALSFGEVLHEPGERIRHAPFPTDPLVSLLPVVEAHPALEAAIAGR